MAQYDARFDIRATDKTGRAIASARKNLEGLGTTAKTVLGGLGVGISAVALTGFGRSVVEYGSSLTDAAEATNTNVEALQALLYAAIQAGASQQQLENLLIRIQKSAYDADRGLSTTADAFDRLGIDVKRFINLPTERKFEELARAYGRATDKNKAYGAVLDIVGTRTAPRLLEVMKRLSVEGFDNVAASAARAGQIMEESTARRMDHLADKAEEFKTKLKNLGSDYIGAFASGLEISNTMLYYQWNENMTIVESFHATMAELTRRYNENSSAAQGQTRAMEDLADARNEAADAAQREIDTQKAFKRADAIAKRYADADRKYREAQMTPDELLQARKQELSGLQEDIRGAEADPHGNHERLLEMMTRERELQYEIYEMEQKRSEELRRRGEMFDSLNKEMESMGETSAESMARLNREIDAIIARMDRLGRGSEEYAKLAEEKMRKGIELRRMAMDERSTDQSALRRELLSPAYSMPESPSEKPERRSNNFMGGLGYSGAMDSPWASEDAPVSAGGIAPPDNTAMVDAAVRAIKSGAARWAAGMDEVASVVGGMAKKVEILSQQMASAR